MKKRVILTLSIIIVAVGIIEAIFFLRLYRLPFVQVSVLGATHSLTHLIGWAAALYLALSTPIYPFVKRLAPIHLKAALNTHMIGNMLAVLFVSIHFAQMLTRTSANFMEFGTLLYAVVALLVATGMVTYSGIAKRHTKQIRFLHFALALTFYAVLITHMIVTLF